MKNINHLFPKVTLKQVTQALASKGWKIEKITKLKPFGGYVTGYFVTDNHGNRKRWASLQDLKINCIDDGRNIDGFMRKKD